MRGGDLVFGGMTFRSNIVVVNAPILCCSYCLPTHDADEQVSMRTILTAGGFELLSS